MIPPKPRDAVELTTRDLALIAEAGPEFRPDIVVGVAVHSADRDLSRCLESVVHQCVDPARVGLVLLADSAGSSPFLPAVPAELQDRTWLLSANCGSPSRARNAILEFTEQSLPWCRWVARMDWDDRFAEESSLAAAIAVGDATDAMYVISGNRVLGSDGQYVRTNPAGKWLQDRHSVVERLRQMAAGTAENELPSCNLVLQNRAGLRYPDTASAEDHWLVADLLINRPRAGAVVESALFADYTLDGSCTSAAKNAQRHRASRQALYAAAQTWLAVSELPGCILGLGQEGIVRVHDGTVFKHFYPDILSPLKAAWLEQALSGPQAIAPKPRFREGESPRSWTATYPWESTRSFASPSKSAVAAFLTECLQHKLVCGNIKRSNFRVRDDGRLVYIDVGNWLVPMDVSVLRDSAARLYSIGVLGASDEELLRRPADHTRPVIWERLLGFSDFYGDVVTERIASKWECATQLSKSVRPCRRRDDVTLLIKACAMDAGFVTAQVRHIVGQLVGPTDFTERVLAIDPYPGPFLRQHCEGSVEALLASANQLCADGVVDRVIVAPTDEGSITAVNATWFGLECLETHSVEGIPISPQLWAFDQVSTRFVLQADCDVLIGRRDRCHDYLSEMINACGAANTLGVAFNIPRDPLSEVRPYEAAPGEHKPEVRCGLLDLERLRAARPLPNRLVEGRLAQPWYRSVHEYQRQNRLRTLRGGDPSTFYIHPLNSLKRSPDNLARVRDLVAQGITPPSHWGRWDVGADVSEWQYPLRPEKIVVLARGRDTPPAKVARFAAGLAMQDDQEFGVIIVDDASCYALHQCLQEETGWLGARLTLVRHLRRHGRMRNNILAVRDLCDDPSSCIVVVDLDDALADPGAIRGVRSLRDQGHDVILAAPFRPDAPTKVYQPDFRSPRTRFGGDVWIHLRAFEKRLFDQLPDDALQLDGDWLWQCDDYAIMIPIVESARSPVYVPEYWYWHERSTGHDLSERASRDATIQRLLAKSSLVNEQKNGRG